MPGIMPLLLEEHPDLYRKFFPDSISGARQEACSYHHSEKIKKGGAL